MNFNPTSKQVGIYYWIGFSGLTKNCASYDQLKHAVICERLVVTLQSEEANNMLFKCMCQAKSASLDGIPYAMCKDNTGDG